MKNNPIIDTNDEDVVELLSNDDVIAEYGDAMASVVGKDHVITWTKFTLTDDKPNANKQRIPIEEFDNIIKSGLYKPIKMAFGEIRDGHDGSTPIGVITNLSKIGNKIVALAALWNHERGEDIGKIKELVDSNKPVNVSWEILYENSSIKNGISDLLDVVLRAVTIVGMPAYAGRTQLLAVAAKKWSDTYIKSLPNSSFMYIGNDGSRYFAFKDAAGKIDTSRFRSIMEEIQTTSLPENTLKTVRHQITKLNSVIKADASIREILELCDDELLTTEDNNLDTKELELKVSQLELNLATANTSLSNKEAELVTAKAELDTNKEALLNLEKEIVPLRDFKVVADTLAEKATKLSAIKLKFEEVGLAKSDEYFNDNADKLLVMDEGSFDFMLQEMVAFKGNSGGEDSASVNTSGIPNIPGNRGSLSITDLATALRERNKKK